MDRADTTAPLAAVTRVDSTTTPSLDVHEGVSGSFCDSDAGHGEAKHSGFDDSGSDVSMADVDTGLSTPTPAVDRVTDMSHAPLTKVDLRDSRRSSSPPLRWDVALAQMGDEDFLVALLIEFYNVVVNRFRDVLRSCNDFEERGGFDNDWYRGELLACCQRLFYAVYCIRGTARQLEAAPMSRAADVLVGRFNCVRDSDVSVDKLKELMRDLCDHGVEPLHLEITRFIRLLERLHHPELRSLGVHDGQLAGLQLATEARFKESLGKQLDLFESRVWNRRKAVLLLRELRKHQRANYAPQLYRLDAVLPINKRRAKADNKCVIM